ncbi:MAG: DUF3160 domain-containing protein [Bacteroidia bacterium]|nr:DUF3160 domain-containing protein [Bacteroidia bacterium]
MILLFAACTGSDQKSEQGSDPEGSDLMADTSHSASSGMTPLQKMGIETFDGKMRDYKNDPKFKEYTYNDPEIAPEFDLNLDISGYSLSELNYLKNYILAINGYMFMDAADRDAFANEGWYQPKYWDENFTPKLTQAESAFVARVEKAMQAQSSKIFANAGGDLVREGEIINLHQMEGEEWNSIREKLLKHGMAIKPAKEEQLWFTYDRNNYSYFPSFVTSDLFLQVFHMYFSYLIRDLEEDHFIPVLTELTKGLHALNEQAAKSAESDTERQAREFNQFYFGLAHDLLTGDRLAIPDAYESEYNSTRKNINQAEGQGNKFLKQPFFDYSLFKPRGHYTRTEDLKKYFRAMIWLQTAPLRVDNQVAFHGAILSACDLQNGAKTGGKSLQSLYSTIFEPVVFIVGEPNKLSLTHVNAALKAMGRPGDASIISDANGMEALQKELVKRDPAKFKMITANQATEEAANKLALHFFPQRYTFDAEILSRMVDIKRKDLKNEDPKRPVPKGLDIFASLGNELAEKILLKDYQEDKKWPAFIDTLAAVREDFAGFQDWDKNVYNQWMHGLDLLSSVDPRRQAPFKTPAWQRKNLNTSLASWAELKHDVILYADQPTAAQMGSGGPDWPEPFVSGYVEPNLQFWEASIKLVKNTQGMLEKFDLLDGTVKEKTATLQEIATRLRDIAKKELEGRDLSRDDQDYIQFIGGKIESLTMEIMEPTVSDWYLIEGPDKFVAVVADVYSYQGVNKKIALEEATGYANTIYVTVEKDGKLYLCRGSVLSYYEFEQPIDQRLTDEEWQEKVKNDDIPPVPVWVKEIMVGVD